MADAMAFSADRARVPTTDSGCGLSVPPLDAAYFSQQLMDNDCAIADNQNVVVFDDLVFDFSVDDLYIPSAEELDGFLNSEHDYQPGHEENFTQFATSVDQFDVALKSTSSEYVRVSGDADSSGLEANPISGYLNVLSPESNGSNQESSDDCGGDVKVLNCPSPESRGSGNCCSNEDSNNCVRKSVSCSPISRNSSIRIGVVDREIKLEGPLKNSGNSSFLKRKKDNEDLLNCNVESRISKCSKSNCNSENENNGGVGEEDDKRKARLIRNRESAHLSRQRKKHYVEELEDKVNMMQSTIRDLNAKISFFMSENATLRQQMGGGGAVLPPPMVPPPPGMYPHPAVMYPWMPYTPPYMVKTQGSQVPLVPIPRLKPHHTAQAPKMSKKNEGQRTKKVAGVSFLGLLFFIMLFGGLAPMVNMRYGGIRNILSGRESYVGGGFYEKHHERVLMVSGSEGGEKNGERRDFSSKSSLHCGQRGHDSGGKTNDDEFVRLCNGSEPLVASLYVPRNDKLVKIDGNLIIHSVLASEKAMSSRGIETGLAVPGDLGSTIPVPGVRRNGASHSPLRALGSSSTENDSRKPKATNGKLQQWFREGLAGPMLSSGMCTEVFQFDVSSAPASGAIVPAATAKNISELQTRNSTQLKARNRRILRSLPIPLPNSSHNITRQHTGRNSQKDNFKGNNSVSPMIVSVLFDPREAGDADADVVMRTKSLSQFFVVVLIDSVKYVTYSCMLPFKGSASHLEYKG